MDSRYAKLTYIERLAIAAVKYKQWAGDIPFSAYPDSFFVELCHVGILRYRKYDDVYLVEKKFEKNIDNTINGLLFEYNNDVEHSGARYRKTGTNSLIGEIR